MRLKSVVSGFEQYSIKKLYLDMSWVGNEYARILSTVVTHTLSSLALEFKGRRNGLNSYCYETLEILRLTNLIV
jgi:hypothetical protein